MKRALAAVWPSLRYLVVGFGTAVVAWFVLGAMLVSFVLYPAFPYAVLLMRRVVAFDRRRVAGFTGTAIPQPYEQLDGAVDALAARCPIPCTVTVESARRLPAAVESAAYFVVAEALTNVAKHSGATQVMVRIAMSGDVLTVEVTDDGHGGADEDGGTGLSGIRRRIAAFDGETSVISPIGGPTVLRAVVPTGA